MLRLVLIEDEILGVSYVFVGSQTSVLLCVDKAGLNINLLTLR